MKYNELTLKDKQRLAFALLHDSHQKEIFNQMPKQLLQFAKRKAPLRRRGFRTKTTPIKQIALLFMFNNRTRPAPEFSNILKSFMLDPKFNVYIHTTSTDKKNLKYDSTSGPFYTIPTQDTSYGAFSITKVMISLLKQAYMDKDNTHFIFLSETDIPLFSNDAIFTFISNNLKNMSWFHFNPGDIGLNDTFTKEALCKIYDVYYGNNGQESSNHLKIKKAQLILKNIDGHLHMESRRIKEFKLLLDDLKPYSTCLSYVLVEQIEKAPYDHLHCHLIKDKNKHINMLYKLGWYVYNIENHGTLVTNTQESKKKLIPYATMFLKNTLRNRPKSYDRITNVMKKLNIMNPILHIIQNYRLEPYIRYLSMFSKEEIEKVNGTSLNIHSTFSRHDLKNGRQQHVLCRNHAKTIIENMHKYPFLKHIKKGSDENFFISVLAKECTDFKTTVKWDTTTNGVSYATFGNNGSHANTFNLTTRDEINHLKKTKSLFVRKVTFSSQKQRIIEKYFRQRSYKDLQSVF